MKKVYKFQKYRKEILETYESNDKVIYVDFALKAENTLIISNIVSGIHYSVGHFENKELIFDNENTIFFKPAIDFDDFDNLNENYETVFDFIFNVIECKCLLCFRKDRTLPVLYRIFQACNVENVNFKHIFDLCSMANDFNIRSNNMVKKEIIKKYGFDIGINFKLLSDTSKGCKRCFQYSVKQYLLYSENNRVPVTLYDLSYWNNKMNNPIITIFTSAGIINYSCKTQIYTSCEADLDKVDMKDLLKQVTTRTKTHNLSEWRG